MSSVIFAAVSVVSVFIGAMGLVTLSTGFLNVLAATRTRRWPRVAGTVLSSQVELKLGPPPREATLFKARVTYRYTVEGAELQGSQITFDEVETELRSAAEELVSRYRVGTTVQVSHDPADPSKAVLEPGVSGPWVLAPTVGVSLLMLGATIFSTVWKASGH